MPVFLACHKWVVTLQGALELAEKGSIKKICHPELVEGPLTILFQRVPFEGIVRDPSTGSG
jgi:hypothetical protein